ncbi:MAG: TIM barrel protein [Bacteroidia bacterium]|nr:TIM barrel protein [Bacteroidia bacterium]
MTQNRREFISTIAAAGAAVPFINKLDSGILPTEPKKYPLRIFSKPLDSYDFGFMCECIAKSGIGGLDLTVRPGGKVEPADVEGKLPKLVEDAKRYNLALDMMVTGIISATDPLTERVLKTASGSGIKHYRLGYYEYDLKTGIWESLQKIKSSLKEVAALNKEYSIHGGYQNHAGARVGGPVWDLYELLRDLQPEFAGCQYDVRHAMVEGANSWILGMRLIAPYIKTLAIKDFTWITGNGKPRAVTVPMGEGMVNWDLFFKTVKELNISGPLTLHVEYPLLEKGEDKLPLLQQQEIIVRKLKKDIDFLNGYLTKYELN